MNIMYNKVKTQIKGNLVNLKYDLFKLEINEDAIRISKDGLRKKLIRLNKFPCNDLVLASRFNEFINDVELYLKYHFKVAAPTLQKIKYKD